MDDWLGGQRWLNRLSLIGCVMGIDTVTAFVECVRQSRLLEPDQLDELTRTLQPRTTDARALAHHLIRKGWLTPYQVNQVFQGQASGLVLGQYRLMERIGEGGMGQVFKARHQAMGRIVALKVIRKERLANAEAVKRFHREIQAVGQMDHANIVRAFDAEAVGSTHYLAMEYVEGIDLGQLLKQKGPLPVAQACDYIRQAAQGLQYAHERGMVHRDIKPGNLFLGRSSDGTNGKSSVTRPMIKILDMGLARLQPHEQEESVTALSIDGSVMGTPDFMAPEQAKNSHKVDHRADIYSLGCTFYYLLTRLPPFPGGSNLEKLLRHQMDAPRPIEEQRPDVPEGVRQVLRRMLAKRPDDRLQTAAEVAAALAPFCGGTAGAGQSPPRISAAVQASVPGPRPIVPLAEAVGAVAMSTPHFGAMPTTAIASPSTRSAVRPRPLPLRRGQRGMNRWVLASLVLVLLGGVILLVRAMMPSDKTGVAAGTGKTSANAATSRRDSPPTTRTNPTPPDRIAFSRFLPSGTSMVIDFNVPELLASQVYRNHKEQLALPIPQLTKTFKDGFDIDLAKEVHHIVIARADLSRPDDFFMVLQGTFDVEKSRTTMKRTSARTYQAKGLNDANGTYYEFTDDINGKPTFVATAGPGVLVMATDHPYLNEVLHRIAKPGRNELKDRELADALDRPLGDKFPTPTVRVVLGGSFAVAEDKTLEEKFSVRSVTGNLFLRQGSRLAVFFRCKDDDAAGRLETDIRGFLQIMAKQRGPAATLAEVLKNGKFNRGKRGNAVVYMHEFSMKELEQILNAK
jgi:eukaryotic-like serine/threonine-protein kinase